MGTLPGGSESAGSTGIVFKQIAALGEAESVLYRFDTFKTWGWIMMDRDRSKSTQVIPSPASLPGIFGDEES